MVCETLRLPPRCNEQQDEIDIIFVHENCTIFTADGEQSFSYSTKKTCEVKNLFFL